MPDMRLPIGLALAAPGRLHDAYGAMDCAQVRELTFEVDQEPHTVWTYDAGTNVEMSKKLQLVFDVGTDFQGGWFVVAGPTWRF